MKNFLLKLICQNDEKLFTVYCIDQDKAYSLGYAILDALREHGIVEIITIEY